MGVLLDGCCRISAMTRRARKTLSIFAVSKGFQDVALIAELVHRLDVAVTLEAALRGDLNGRALRRHGSSFGW